MWMEWHEGHSWGSWRAHLDDALEFFFPVVVGTEDFKTELGIVQLFQNYPNPFTDQTTITYRLPENSKIELSVYNLFGKKLRILMDKRQSAGEHSIQFESGDFSSGIYFIKIRVGNIEVTRKMVLMM